MGQSNTVLLVEDNPGDARLIRTWLETIRPGQFQLEHVERIADARERTRTPFTAVILDLGLPDSHGLETVDRFRNGRPPCPLVVLTGNDEEGLAQAAMERGADELVFKDEASPERLIVALERAMARHRRRDRQVEMNRRLRGELIVLERALDRHPDVIALCDGHGKIAYANLAARAVLGLRAGVDLPEPLRGLPREEGTAELTVGGPGEQPRRVHVMRGPPIRSEDGVQHGILVGRSLDADLPPLRTRASDALFMLGTADVLLERAAVLMRRTAALAASNEDLTMLPLSTHMLGLELLRLAMSLKDMISAAAHACEVETA